VTLTDQVCPSGGSNDLDSIAAAYTEFSSHAGQRIPYGFTVEAEFFRYLIVGQALIDKVKDGGLLGRQRARGWPGRTGDPSSQNGLAQSEHLMLEGVPLRLFEDLCGDLDNRIPLRLIHVGARVAMQVEAAGSLARPGEPGLVPGGRLMTSCRLSISHDHAIAKDCR